MLYAFRIQYAMLCYAGLCYAVRPCQGRPCHAHAMPCRSANTVSVIIKCSPPRLYLTGVTTRDCTCVPTSTLESWPGRCFWSSAVRSLVIVLNSTGCWYPPGSLVLLVPLCAPAPALAASRTCTAQFTACTLSAPLATQSQLASWPSTRLSYLALSLPPPPLLPHSLRPSHPATLALWCNALATTSTRFPPIGHLLGSDRDTKTNLGTNPSISSKLVGAGIDTLNHLLTHTPARPAPSFSLCLASAHLVFPWPPPSLFPLDCNAGKIAQLSLTRARPLLAAHVPVPS